MVGCKDQNSTEPFLIGVKLAGITGTETCRSKEEFKKNGVGKKTAELKEKVMHAQFLRDIDNELNSGKMINVRVGPG